MLCQSQFASSKHLRLLLNMQLQRATGSDTAERQRVNLFVMKNRFDKPTLLIPHQLA